MGNLLRTRPLLTVSSSLRFSSLKFISSMSIFWRVVSWTVVSSCNIRAWLWSRLTCSSRDASCKHGEREGNVLFNDALNTFYLPLYGVRHMVKDHSDSEKRNPLPPHRLLLSINSKGSFICTIPQTGLNISRSLLNQSWSTGWNGK